MLVLTERRFLKRRETPHEQYILWSTHSERLMEKQPAWLNYWAYVLCQL